MIEVIGLTKSYGGKTRVDDVTFSVDDGRIVGFIGPNGAGKTTTMRTALGLEKPDSGRALFDGRPYGELPNPRQSVGAVLDAGALIPDLRAIELLRYCARIQGVNKARAERVLDVVDLGEGRRRRVRELSLGMRQRLALAAAIMGNPGNYVLDEPLNGLDPSGIQWLRHLLLQLRDAGSAILLSSHIITELELVADDVVLISDGVLKLRSSLADLARGAGARVRVITEDADTLVAVAKRSGGAIVEANGRAVVIAGLTAREVFSLAAMHGVVLDELRTESVSLDDVYRRIVDTKVEGEVH
ncbi:ABC transporter ATP-binding protein [Arthrobacter bambusae]|uniref:ABC transporter ATP-binding protein n=1 Tax=Arthrobacter bambusae TaxID=1338426 RepID=UPI002782B6DD|nr:ATP-binding cassette domain-containing protein [Arthrobacter bambusae]MDQ0028960.1 ABC-2 type transport system ATP-binding protein [Arthrobacter bambusae]MDQ0098638.1 ABC-2 type transport system ATP-binding protein [Arthrobacter bambusae]